MSYNGGSYGISDGFISSLRTLFNALDSGGSGYIDIKEIERLWADGETEGLPPGVMDALKKTAEPSGKLSFDRFVNGLKIAMFRNNNSSQPRSLVSQSTPNFNFMPTSENAKQSAFHIVQRNNVPNNHAKNPNDHDSLVQQRTNSMPLLDDPKLSTKSPTHLGVHTMNKVNEYHGDFNRPKDRWDRRPGDGRSSVATATALEFMNKNFIEQQKQEEGRSNSFTHKRREPRRHTLSSGLDNNMIRRLKLLEDERTILEEGLEAIEKARVWYGEQIRLVTEKQNNLGRTTSDFQNDHSVEANKERNDLLTVRVRELSQQLKALTESPQKALVGQLGLALGESPNRRNKRPVTSQDTESALLILKAQNRLLTKEVGERTNQVEQLEREKAQLIQKMFHSPSQQPPTPASPNPRATVQQNTAYSTSTQNLQYPVSQYTGPQAVPSSTQYQSARSLHTSGSQSSLQKTGTQYNTQYTGKYTGQYAVANSVPQMAKYVGNDTAQYTGPPRSVPYKTSDNTTFI